MTTNLVKAKVSTVVDKQVPEFIRDDHETMVKFLKAYYDFMELSSDPNSELPNPGYILRNIESVRDIDDTVDKFVDYLTNELMIDIPVTVLSDKRLLAKHIHQLYKTKGTEQSYELLFRILFNESIEIYYPSVDILRISDSAYNTNTVLKVVGFTGNPFNLIGQTITQPQHWTASLFVELGELIYYANRIYKVTDSGNLDSTMVPIHTVGTSINGTTQLEFLTYTELYLDQTAETASAVVDSVSQYIVDTLQIAELKLNPETIVGSFITNAPIYGEDVIDGSNIAMTIKPVISDVKITNRGGYYKPSDKFEIIKESEIDPGAGLACEVGSIGSGGIDGVLIETQGSGYEIGDEIYFDNTDTSGFGAKAIVSDIERGSIILEDDTAAAISADTIDFTADTTNINAAVGAGYVGFLRSEIDRKIAFDSVILTSHISTMQRLDNITLVTTSTEHNLIDDQQITIWFNETSEAYPFFDKFAAQDIKVLKRIDETRFTYTNAGLNTAIISPTSGMVIPADKESIGAIKEITVLEKGSHYRKPPTAYVTNYIKVREYTGDFIIGESILGNSSDILNIPRGTVVSWDPETLVIKYLTVEGSLDGCYTITGQDSGTYSIISTVREHAINAELYAYGSNIGSLRSINVTGIGVNYSSIPTIIPAANAIITRQWRESLANKYLNNIPFGIGERVFADAEKFQLEETNLDEILLLETGDKIISENSPVGYCSFYDDKLNLLSIRTDNKTGVFNKDQIIQGEFSGARARIYNMNQASATASSSGVGHYTGSFMNTRGMISESSKHILDSYFYQEYSYVVRCTESINKWRDAVKKLLHPVGIMLFGEVQLISSGATANRPVYTNLPNRQVIKLFMKIVDAKIKSFRHDTVLYIQHFFDQSAGLSIAQSELLPVLWFKQDDPYHIYWLDVRPEFVSTTRKIDLSPRLGAVKLACGPRHGDLEKFKFCIPPYEAGAKATADVYKDVWNQPYTGTNNAGYWNGLVGSWNPVMSANVTRSTSNAHTFTAVTGSSWTSQVYSKEGYKYNLYMSAIVPGTQDTYFGLTSNPSLDASYVSIDYAFRTQSNNTVVIWESNSSVGIVGTYTPGDVFSITYDGAFIKYYLNDVLLRTVNRTSSSTLYFDSSFSAGTSTLSNINFGPLPVLGYPGTIANTQIKDFGDLIVGNVINNPDKKMNIQVFDAYIDILKP